MVSALEPVPTRVLINSTPTGFEWAPHPLWWWGKKKVFPGSSAGKESTCNSGDSGPISELGRSTGEGIGYPLQYSWASLVAQVVKTLPAMQETWAWSLGWEDPLEKEMATHFSVLDWKVPWIEEPNGLQSSGSWRVRHDWETEMHTHTTVSHACKRPPTDFQKIQEELGHLHVRYSSSWTLTSTFCIVTS